MDVSQLIATEVAEVLSGNSIYSNYRDRWQFLYESYIGGEEYRLAGHLTKYQLETAGEYQQRLATTPLENHCKSTIDVYNSFLFREAPTRDLSGIDGSITEQFLKDCDQDGRSFDQMMREASAWSSVFGHVWMVLVKPNLELATQADEIALGVRPYLNMLTPLAVVDWNWSRTPIGKYKLDYFKYIEDVNGNIRTVREWTPDYIGTYVVDTEEESILERYIEPNGLGYIPAVCAYNMRSTVRGIGISDISDIADAQKMIFNCTSEAVESIKLDTHPSLVATPETNVGTGAGALIHMPENLDPGLKPYALEFSGASISSIYESINHTIMAIDKMANTGAIRSTEARRMSGVAQEQEFQLLSARISQKADSLQLTEENIWKIYSDYMGSEWTGYVEYPNSFNIRDSHLDLDFYNKTLLTNVPSKQLRDQIYGLIAELVVEDPDVLSSVKQEIQNAPSGNYSDMFEPHIMIDPQTGEQRIAQTEQEHLDLAEQGWVHE